MNKDTVITIGRQFGSGGREIGKKLSQKLDIPFYDRDLIVLASEQSGITKELFEEADEKATNTFLQSFAAASFVPGNRISLPTEISINDRLFFSQAEVIAKLAEKGACVIVGRCADYILRKRTNCLNLFIHSDLDVRVERVARLYDLSADEARNTIIKTDKKRASYYNYYTNKSWNHLESYNLTINSAFLGIDGTIEFIFGLVKAYDKL